MCQIAGMPYRVIQHSTGNVGTHALRAVIEHPDLELVGLWVHSPDKVGRDAGELCGLPPVGVVATETGAIAVELRADGVALRGEVEGGDSSEDFVPGTLDGEPTALGFNWTYLEAALCHLEAEMVELAVTPQGNSAVLRDPENDSVAHVVMPMRL